ncbi:hypothetical protein [Virgibacillus sp. JSM 102003]
MVLRNLPVLANPDVNNNLTGVSYIINRIENMGFEAKVVQTNTK